MNNQLQPVVWLTLICKRGCTYAGRDKQAQKYLKCHLCGSKEVLTVLDGKGWTKQSVPWFGVKEQEVSVDRRYWMTEEN